MNTYRVNGISIDEDRFKEKIIRTNIQKKNPYTWIISSYQSFH